MATLPVWIWIVGVVILGAVLFYGIMQNKHRSQREKNISQSATKKLYEQEDRSS